LILNITLGAARFENAERSAVRTKRLGDWLAMIIFSFLSREALRSAGSQ
jgi:hypothetical protein